MLNVGVARNMTVGELIVGGLVVAAIAVGAAWLRGYYLSTQTQKPLDLGDVPGKPPPKPPPPPPDAPSA